MGLEGDNDDAELLLNNGERGAVDAVGRSRSPPSSSSFCVRMLPVACVQLLAGAGGKKINHSRRRCAVFLLLAISISSLLFLVPYYTAATNGGPRGPDFVSAFDYGGNFAEATIISGGQGDSSSEVEHSPNSSAIQSEPTIIGPKTPDENSLLLRVRWSNQPVSTGNVTLLLPSYPIFPTPQPVLQPLPTNDDPSATKIILFWTKLFFQADWGLGSTGTEPFKKLNCPISNCMVTDDRSYLPKADAVLINFRDDFSYSDRPTPEQRKQNQLWMFVLWETPDHTYHWVWQESHRLFRQLKNFPNFFNWTMTYRLESDVRFHYGRYIPLPTPDFTRTGFDRLANKSKTAVWMTSHCDTVSHRESYITQLMKHIDVDTIGGCKDTNLAGLTQGICARPTHFSGSKDECLDYLSETYKFYLSFENSLCRDYVTEKFYRAAKMDLIPVVLNGGDMSLFAPPHSYIDAEQFSSPEELANFLKKVGSDSALYNSYFWWKPFYDVEHMWDKASYVKHFCDLCAKVTYASIFEPKSYADIDDWWTTEGRCYEGKQF